MAHNARPVIDEIHRVLPVARLQYPIKNAAALAAARTGDVVSTEGRTLRVDSLLQHLPRKEFPIASAADLEHKISAHITQRAKIADQGLNELTRQLPALRYPIANPTQLIAETSGKRYNYRGKPVDFQKAAAHIPASDFPITSSSDFHNKMSSLAFTLALTTSGPRAIL